VDPALGALEGALARHSRTLYLRAGQDPADRRLAHTWEVDLAAGVCRAEGIDFGAAVIGGLRRDLKRYTLDLDDPVCRSEAGELLRSADAALGVCLALREQAHRGRRVRVVGAELLYVPAGIFNIFSRQEASGFDFVDFADTYAHYYSGGPLSWHHLGIQNITRHRLDTHMDVRREDFEAWLATHPDAEAALAEAARVTRHNRTAASPPPAAQSLLQRIASTRAQGGKVVGVFGHITFDLGGLQDTGPAHADMVDWLNHTLELLGRTDHLVLLKPHPEEGRYKGNRRPCQLLSELLRTWTPAWSGAARWRSSWRWPAFRWWWRAARRTTGAASICPTRATARTTPSSSPTSARCGSPKPSGGESRCSCAMCPNGLSSTCPTCTVPGAARADRKSGSGQR
jgi:hypothetical protein